MHMHTHMHTHAHTHAHTHTHTHTHRVMQKASLVVLVEKNLSAKAWLRW